MPVKTSKDSPIRICEIAPDNATGGWIAITIAPGKKSNGINGVIWNRDLDEDLDRLRSMGVDTLVPLIEDHELVSLKIPNFVEAATARGIGVRRFPMPDGSIPKDLPETISFISGLLELYSQGRKIVIHCKGGLGRAGMMAACIRLDLSLDANPDTAFKSVRRLRSQNAIETKIQEDFIKRYWEQRNK